jgi:hypothetical protein
MVDLARGQAEGLTGAAVLDGFGVTLTGGMGLEAGPGICTGPTGYLGVVATVSDFSAVAPSANFARSLVVCRPNLVNTSYITSPTDPTITVPLQTLQESIIAVIQGVPSATPAYPATLPNDVILWGVRTAASQTTLLSSDIDFEVRDIPGKHSNFQQDAGKYDDRLRCYRQSSTTVGIKPSQLEPPFARVFTYVNQGKPSIFPVASGVYNPVDTFVNLQTGAITGGDTTTSSPMAATVPTAGNAIVATLSLTQSDTLVLAYGTIGTRLQCFTGIKNRQSSGAGSVAFSASSKPLVFIVVGSADGTNVTELDIFDGRGYGAGAQSPYAADVIVGNQSFCTHATLELAVADSSVGANQRVLLTQSQNSPGVATVLSKAGWRIEMLPGVTYTATTGGSGFSCQAAGIEFSHCRFYAYTSCIFGTSAWTYGRILACNFQGCTTEVDDSNSPAGEKPALYANISE